MKTKIKIKRWYCNILKYMIDQKLNLKIIKVLHFKIKRKIMNFKLKIQGKLQDLPESLCSCSKLLIEHSNLHEYKSGRSNIP